DLQRDFLPRQILPTLRAPFVTQTPRAGAGITAPRAREPRAYRTPPWTRHRRRGDGLLLCRDPLRRRRRQHSASPVAERGRGGGGPPTSQRSSAESSTLRSASDGRAALADLRLDLALFCS